MEGACTKKCFNWFSFLNEWNCFHVSFTFSVAPPVWQLSAKSRQVFYWKKKKKKGSSKFSIHVLPACRIFPIFSSTKIKAVRVSEKRNFQSSRYQRWTAEKQTWRNSSEKNYWERAQRNRRHAAVEFTHISQSIIFTSFLPPWFITSIKEQGIVQHRLAGTAGDGSFWKAGCSARRQPHQHRQPQGNVSLEGCEQHTNTSVTPEGPGRFFSLSIAADWKWWLITFWWSEHVKKDRNRTKERLSRTISSLFI